MTHIDHIVDGSQGEGGGQILRTALSLAMCLGVSVRIENIRAGRTKPGLMRSHLAAVRAAAQISCAETHGAQVGSTRLEFVPQSNAITGGTYRFAIGTAGSTTLLLQTLLPALVRADSTSLLMLSGGTHNDMAPSVDFIETAFAPVVAKIGWSFKSELRSHGFFPSGGGDWQVIVEPSGKAGNAEPLVLQERGELRAREVVAKVARLPLHIAQRELETVAKRIHLRKNELVAQSVESPGSGNIVSARFRFDNLSAVFEERGAKGVSAEKVAKQLTRSVTDYFEHDAPVDEFLADQLLLPMVLNAGGVFKTRELSEHARTNMAVIDQLMGRSCFELTQRGPRQKDVEVRVRGMTAG